MKDDGHVSLSDRSGSDVRRRLHGGRRLATHLPDYRQLPAVPPTQTLAIWITLHEHAQRRESGLGVRNTCLCLPKDLSASQLAAGPVTLGAGAGDQM